MAPLELIRDLQAILREETVILASPEDAQYFREWAKKRGAPPPAPKPIVKKAPQPIPEPIVTLPPVPKAEPIAAPSPLPPQPTVSCAPAPAPHEPIEPKSLGALRGWVKKIAPEMVLIDQIPSDADAKRLAQRWKTKNQAAPISVLYLAEDAVHKKLLEEIVVALDVFFGPARLISAGTIEREKQWEAFLSVEGLKLVVACDYTLWQLGGLITHYKEQTGHRMLKNIPLFLLPDLSLYLKDPLLKRSLWKALCQKLSS